MADKDREERLAAALRENLRRRKAQARSLSDGADRRTSTKAIEGELQASANSEAQLELGTALLRTSRTAEELSRAVELIESASAAGYAPASEQCALLECVGVGRPIDWAKAFDRMQQAAEQGSLSAARQLLLFADPKGDASPPESPPPRNWSKVRGRIDERTMLASVQGLTAIERPFVGVFQKFASAAECRWLIDRARECLGPSTITDYSTGVLRPDPRRTSRTAMFTFDEVDLVIEMIRARIAATLNLQLPRFEASQVIHYAPGQEFKPHHDYFDPAAQGFQEEISTRGQRVATFLIYLNDQFNGGETRFPSLGFNYRGGIGDAIAFASVDPDGRPNPLTLHAGLAPASGEKWIFSQWVRDRAPGRQAL
ncbi:MAG TPA: 2OG-Fe(II) oxygenase [Sphingomicrobium sp.]